MNLPAWRDMALGISCPFDGPRQPSSSEWEQVGVLTASTLYLSRDQTYRGHCILVLDVQHATLPDQLRRQDWARYCDDLYRSQAAILRVTKCDHFNIASLGNVVPHLHWHVIPRYHTDPRWGAPIWTENMRRTLLPSAEFNDLLDHLRNALASPL